MVVPLDSDFAVPRATAAIRGLLRQLQAAGMQGAVGWFMVASGFLADSVAVEPARLVAHLMLALLLAHSCFGGDRLVAATAGVSTAAMTIFGFLLVEFWRWRDGRKTS